MNTFAYRSAVAAGLLLAMGLAPATAQAAFFGEATDPAGDSADPLAHPSRDLLAAGLAYDRTRGSFVAAVQLAAAPVDSEVPGMVTVFVGTRGPAGCNVYPAVGVSAVTTELDARWHRLDGPTESDGGRAVQEGYRAAVQLYRAEDKEALRGVQPDCALATLSPVGEPVIYDAIEVPLTPMPELQAELRGVPKSFAAGRSRQVKVRLSNPGDERTGRVKVRFKTPRGVKVSPSTVRSDPLRAGQRRTVKVRVTMSSRAPQGEELTVIATAPGKLEARHEARLWRSTRSKRRGGGGGSHTPKTCIRYVPDLSGETGGSLGLLPC